MSGGGPHKARRRRRAFQKRKPPIGARPGEMAIAAGAPPPTIHVTTYDKERVRELAVKDVEQLAALRDGAGVAWIEVHGLGDERVLRRIGEIFGVHPLALADVVNVPQRPKFEAYEGHDLLIARIARLNEGHDCDFEQVGIVLGPRWVLSFQERDGEVFEPVRARIRGGALVRSMGSDYLAYALVDTLIDGYYPVVEGLGDVLEELEEEVVARPSKATLARIHHTRRQLLTLHRSVWQQRDALNALLRDESPRITQGVRVYVRDAYDHAVQIIDVVETYREMGVGLMDVYLSSVSNRMNEVMKVLTVMATIFIPLTFLVGVYGMNFEQMPELRLRWAYPALWLLMLGIAAVMVVYFRRRGWIGGEGGDSFGAAPPYEKKSQVESAKIGSSTAPE